MLLTVKQAAEKMKCSPDSIRRKIYAGILKAVKRYGFLHVSDEDLNNLKYRPPGKPLKQYEVSYTCNGKRLIMPVQGSAALQKKMAELRVKGAMPKVINT